MVVSHPYQLCLRNPNELANDWRRPIIIPIFKKMEKENTRYKLVTLTLKLWTVLEYTVYCEHK